MKSAQRLVEALAREGMRTCFANPGTSEMHFVAALDAVPAMRPVLCLFDGVATGAADGYGRMADAPGLALLHLGPGLANGLANLHNAFRARTPLLCLVGEQATYHRSNDAPLQSDITALARPVSRWVETAETPSELLSVAQRGVEAARRNGPATLILPTDVAWSDEEPARPASARENRRTTEWEREIDRAASRLREGGCAVLVGARRVSARACAAAERLRAAGAAVFMETFPARVERGGGRPALARLPYLTEMACEALAGARTLILVGARAPVAFFALPGLPTRLAPEGTELIELVQPGGEIEDALEALTGARAGTAEAPSPPRESYTLVPAQDGPLSPDGLARVLAALLPENAIVSDESVTLGLHAFDYAADAAPHDWLSLTGGAIGQGLPVATGAAAACPDRPVVALEADGSALYTIQALWTQAREGLNVTNIILNNAAYSILNMELSRTSADPGGRGARELFDLSRPDIDFTKIAEGFGAPAKRVRTIREFEAALSLAFAEPGPKLIEAMFR